MNNYEHHIAALEAKGFAVERGMLIGTFDQPNVIGLRFISANTQVDNYLLTEFFEADKAHPKLGAADEVVGPEGAYRVQPILKN